MSVRPSTIQKGPGALLPFKPCSSFRSICSIALTPGFNTFYTWGKRDQVPMFSFQAKALCRAWCYLALLALAYAASSSELATTPQSSLDPQPDHSQTDALIAARQFANPPPFMNWLGSIGGVLGIISFTTDTILRIIELTRKKPPHLTTEKEFKEKMEGAESRVFRGKKFPKKKGDPAWRVSIRKQYPILIAPLGE